MLELIFKPGDKVHYTSPSGKKENGKIKSLTEDGKAAFVVYHCNNEWDKYYDYTGARTELDQITHGWIDEQEINEWKELALSQVKK